MPRLMACALLLISTGTACDGAPSPPPPPRSRVAAVAAPAGPQVKLDAFCELQASADTATTLSWPELDGAAPPMAGRWSWVSLWATWCLPCIAELPLMKSWEQKLAAEGLPVAITHISVDARAEDLDKFRSANATAPKGPRVADQASVEPWLGSLGLDAGAAIPIHLFVDPDKKIRCVRVGAVSEADYRAV